MKKRNVNSRKYKGWGIPLLTSFMGTQAIVYNCQFSESSKIRTTNHNEIMAMIDKFDYAFFNMIKIKELKPKKPFIYHWADKLKLGEY